MPKFQKLDSKKQPIEGEYREFNYHEAARLRKRKNSFWREVKGDGPKISRETPIAATEENKKLLAEFPTNKGKQLDWVKNCESIEELEAVKQLTNAPTVLDAIAARITELNNK